MKPRLSWLLLTLVFSLHLAAQPTTGLPEKIDKYLLQHFSEAGPGGVVLVAKGDEIIFRKAYGLANESLQQKNTPETIFRIGSITKQFTSTAILRLARAGKLSLQDTITKFLPGYPMGDKPITITHLLTHTSGIKSYTSLPQLVGSKESKEKAYSVNEVIAAFKGELKDFAPGEDYRYNNSGYYLLGAIIEKVSGVAWGDYLATHFFKPLGMSSTYCNDLGIKGEATGYYKSRKKYNVADVVHPSASYAAGAMASTVDDLWKWNKAVFSGEVEGFDLLQIAWRPVRLNNGVTKPYGFGWQISGEGNGKRIGHGGTIDGFQSFAWYVPESKIFVVILSNNMGANPGEYASEILSMMK